MPGKAITRETIRKNTISAMKTLGIYKAEYGPIIDIYAELGEQYNRLTKEFISSGYRYDECTSQGGAKKSPLVLTIEALRKDILLYSDRLGLNPKAFDSFDTPKARKGQSALALALNRAASSR